MASRFEVAILITSLVICALGLVVVGLMLSRLERNRLSERLSNIAAHPPTVEEIELNRPFSERVWQPVLAQFNRLGVRLLGGRWTKASGGESAAEKTRRRLLLAGSPHRWTPADWLGIKLICAVSGGVLVALLFSGAPLAFRILLIGGSMYGGYIVPEFWLKRQISARQRAIQRALPDVLDLLVISVQGGLGFDAAVAHVAGQTDNVLTQELARMLAEMRVGRSRRDAMRELIARTEVPELSQFVWALIQADQLGVSVVQVLMAQTKLMRVQRRQRVQQQAQAAPLKMIIPLGVFIFPALCVVVLGPAVPMVMTAFRR
jgi:tight adherence protein C